MAQYLATAEFCAATESVTRDPGFAPLFRQPGRSAALLRSEHATTFRGFAAALIDAGVPYDVTVERPPVATAVTPPRPDAPDSNGWLLAAGMRPEAKEEAHIAYLLGSGVVSAAVVKLPDLAKQPVPVRLGDSVPLASGSLDEGEQGLSNRLVARTLGPLTFEEHIMGGAVYLAARHHWLVQPVTSLQPA